MRPRVLLDVDGVLADFHTPCLDLINRYGGTKHSMNDLSEWDLFNALGIDPEVKHLVYEYMKQPGWCRQIGVYPEAKEGVARLREVADVYVVTSPMNGPTWTHERDRWLMYHFGFTTKQIVHTSAKYLCAGDALIDDKIDNLLKWKRCHPGGLGIRWIVKQYRHHEYEGPSTDNWDKVIELVQTGAPFRAINRYWSTP